MKTGKTDRMKNKQKRKRIGKEVFKAKNFIVMG
jgi:hypothetical protein